MVTLFDDLQQRHTHTPQPLLTVGGITAGAQGYFLARLFVERGVSLCVVTPDAHQRDVLYDDLQCFLAGMPDAPQHWQGLESVVCRYVHRPAASLDAVAFQQHQALSCYQPLWRLLGEDPVVVVTAAESLRYGVPPPHALQSRVLEVRLGASFPLSGLATALVERGYRRVPMVETVGEFALRGGILDLFSPGQTHPVRIEFFGDDVESIRAFDIQSQTSTATLQTVVIAPMLPPQPAAVGTRRRAGHVCSTIWRRRAGRSPPALRYLEGWQQQLPGAWPWGVEQFFYEAWCSPLAYLPTTGLLCGVDVEDISLTLSQLPPPDAMLLGETVVPLPEEHLIADTALAQQLQERLDVALRRYDEPGMARQETGSQTARRPTVLRGC